ncbi:MAG: hypothetical protein SFZ24_12510 [Planctomycetota bacterium]|nr:hypothetical protein [Planctomycetota bacterium]
MNPVVLLIYAALAYLAIGALIALPLAFRGVNRLDPAARGSGLAFRLVIIPGLAAFWPIVLARWLRAPAPGDH